MSFLQYQNYKYSGFDWLGKIPDEWSLGKFRHLFSESSEKIESGVYGEMLSVSGYRGIEVKEYADENQKRTEENLIGYRIVHRGQLVVNTMWLNYAGLGISQLEGHVSPAYRSYWVNDGLHKPFVHHLMRSSLYVLGYTKYLTGVRPNSLQMGRDDLMSFPIVIPSLKEQKVIASFLDHEVTKIDKLVAEQKKLIELLKEKRQVIISNAVTKGLDPKVKMKDSGVAWLGDIPEHWELKKIKWCAKLKNEKTSDRSNTIALENIEGWTGRLIDTESEFEGDGVKFNEGDVLFGKLRPYLAKVFRATMKGEAIGDFFVLELKQDLLSQFAERLLISSEFIDAINSSTYGTKMPRVNWEYFSSMSIPLPPKNEQIQISNYLVTAIEEMNELIATSNNAVALLEERRSALISAAVTGQIDVRNYQLKEIA
jgi:type I restriction enzyme S subunit